LWRREIAAWHRRARRYSGALREVPPWVRSADLLLAASTGQVAPLCLLKSLTGLPCPTCGFTRGMLTIVRGHPVRGWLYNPLLFSALALLAVALAGWLFWGRELRIHLTHRERTVAYLVGVVLFMADWLYVIRYVG